MLYFVAVTKQLYNILMPESPKVIKFLRELTVTIRFLSWRWMKQFHSYLFPIMHSLIKIFYMFLIKNVLIHYIYIIDLYFLLNIWWLLITIFLSIRNILHYFYYGRSWLIKLVDQHASYCIGTLRDNCSKYEWGILVPNTILKWCL